MPEHTLKFPRTVLLVALLTTLAFAVPAQAVVTPSWQNAKPTVLPAGATGIYDGYLPFLSCPSTGNCVAAGIYADSAGVEHGLLINEVNGTWQAAQPVTPPTNAVARDGVTLSGVACGSVGNCSAVGTYSDAASNQLTFVADEVGGVWQPGKDVLLPANAAKANQVSDLHSISCRSPGNCSAVGTYSAASNPLSATEPMSADEVNGVWTSAQEISLPANVGANPYATFNQISCSSVGNCGAVGSYIDANNVTHAITANEVNRTWRSAAPTLLPGNASIYAGATLSEISCASPGNCSAVGTYNAVGGGVQAFVASQSHGTWLRASELTMPAGAAANPQVMLFGFQGISCFSPGNCATGGQYLDKSGNYQGFLTNEIGAKWRPSTELVLPSGATQTSHNGGVVALSCSAVGYCSAGAAYIDASGDYQAMIVNEVANMWRPGVRIELPTNTFGVGIGGGVYALVCQRSGACDAVGSYLRTSSVYTGFTVKGA